ncbi:MAG: hypothetical protein CMJ89_10500 [Planctomycetes bacterium]|nr:hypothetical protein [Planctomycetota bacterium]
MLHGIVFGDCRSRLSQTTQDFRGSAESRISCPKKDGGGVVCAGRRHPLRRLEFLFDHSPEWLYSPAIRESTPVQQWIEEDPRLVAAVPLSGRAVQ